VETVHARLTDYLPEPGYFLAGAIAGGVSRTATAPLDRLKVYLLVNTKTSASAALAAATHGHPVAAAKTAAKPITAAVASLYKSGGLRTFFAGKCLDVRYTPPWGFPRSGGGKKNHRRLPLIFPSG
jgi:solute carrier family 25 phosphate transporter 23/24/25/41